MRAFVSMWERITRDRYGVDDPKLRRFRYGVQVNSLGLTEEQPENNAWRIAIETLGVLLSRDARCRALQLPAWNEAMSLPRAWDQQWSLRLQQILAFETDLLEYPDLFEGSVVVESKTRALIAEADAELERIEAMGGVLAAVDSGYLKSSLVKSMATRMSRIATGGLPVVGLNRYRDGLPSPLVGGEDAGRFQQDSDSVREALESLAASKSRRSADRVESSLAALQDVARNGGNLVEPSIECALARVTTGEWADALRAVFGDYRAATGVEGQVAQLDDARVEVVRARIDEFESERGRRPRLLVGKPGLDGHSNGAEMIAVAAKTAGFDVVYAGIRMTPEAIVRSAVEEDADLLGISILSGSHLPIADALLSELRAAGAKLPVVVGGIVPPEDAAVLCERGVARVFTPSDFELTDIVESMMDVIEAHAD